MQETTVESRFLAAMQESYRMVRVHGVRSNQKTRVLHGWVQDELRRELGAEYNFTGQSPTSSSEANVGGMYYEKNVDVLVTRDSQDLGVVSVKFVISNFWQNAVNYFEQQIGETANLRRRNIVYGNLFCLTQPIPYKRRDGTVSRLEELRERDVQRYIRLRDDHEHIHAPDEMAIAIVNLNVDRDRITGLTDPNILNISASSCAALLNQLSIGPFFQRMARRIEVRYLSP